MLFTNDVCRQIHLDELSAIPKYLQISNSIISAVDAGRLSKGALMPSINDLSNELCVSRGTIEKGYRHLKAIKAIRSFPGKGYYISDLSFRQQKKVCLLFNKLSAQKKIIYDAFTEALGACGTVTLFIYNNDVTQFETVLKNNIDVYTHFVIIPHFIEGEQLAFDLINSMPEGSVILLDKKPPEITRHSGAVYENFEKDIYRVLVQLRDRISGYEQLHLIFPQKSYYPKEIVKGMTLFCRQFGISYSVIDDLACKRLRRGELYITLSEDDLVAFLDELAQTSLRLGEDIGVISYNETPIKKFLHRGITTISTDFKLLGNLAAQLVLEEAPQNIEVPFYLTLRPSL